MYIVNPTKNFMKTKKQIQERIKELQEEKTKVSSSCSKNKYNFAIGELLWIMT
jgi:hypothetical protein